MKNLLRIKGIKSLTRNQLKHLNGGASHTDGIYTCDSGCVLQYQYVNSLMPSTAHSPSCFCDRGTASDGTHVVEYLPAEQVQ